MCHLILLLPVLGLPVFWLMPLAAAIPAYGTLFAASLWLYWLALRAMRRPIVSGREQLLQATARVIETGPRYARVVIGSEIWTAESDEELRLDDMVKVIGVDGLRLKVALLRTRGASNGPKPARELHPAPAAPSQRPLS